MPVRLSEPYPHVPKITVPLDKGGAGPQALLRKAPREGSPRRLPVAPSKRFSPQTSLAEGLPQISVGQRPTSPPPSRRNLTQRRREPQRRSPFPPRPFFLLSYFLLPRPHSILTHLSPSLPILLNRIPALSAPSAPPREIFHSSRRRLSPPKKKIRSRPFPSV